ncbi:MAG: phosphoenolpyruvate carboxykinase (ATP), partial [Clostridia bacterium]|nr:phosphoenolpyruvate carboxykinase (ATP) [Clostridia bacterium]
STCFGAPFLPLPASRYAELLGDHIDKSGANVYLVNTGWSGGSYGKGGKRMSLPYTRAMVTACLNGELEKSEFELDPIFNVMVPTSCPGVPSEVLSPKKVWADKAAYEEIAKSLAARFQKNFAKYENMDQKIIEAGPKA